MKVVVAVVLLAGLGTVVATIWIGSLVREEQVVDRPYETGLGYDADRAARASLGWTAKVSEEGLRPGLSALRVALWDGAGRPLEGAEVKLSVSRAETSRDRASAPARALGGGVYAAELPFASDGIWDVAIDVRRGKDRLVLERAVVVGKAPPAPAPPPRDPEGGVEEPGAFSLSPREAGGEGRREGGTQARCDLALAPCTRALDGGATLELDLAPRPLRTMKDLEVGVAVRDAAGRPVPGATATVSFSMPGMFMGENRVALAPDHGRLAGKGVLVRCPSGRRDWRAEVAVSRPGMPVATVPFDFRVTE